LIEENVNVAVENFSFFLVDMPAREVKLFRETKQDKTKPQASVAKNIEFHVTRVAQRPTKEFYLCLISGTK
jgi:hypothetical protein